MYVMTHAYFVSCKCNTHPQHGPLLLFVLRDVLTKSTRKTHSGTDAAVNMMLPQYDLIVWRHCFNITPGMICCLRVANFLVHDPPYLTSAVLFFILTVFYFFGSALNTIQEFFKNVG